MCRLYGFRATAPTKVECTLVHAQNALLLQSRVDSRGEANADGWGIAYYQDGVPEVERRDRAAFEDVLFGATAERMFAKTVVAHIRRATIGSVGLVNTHPFVFGPWTFAHNGTITAFHKIRSELEAETAPELQRHRVGASDSEQAFYWLLTRLAQAGIDLGGRGARLDTLMKVLGDSVAHLAEQNDRAGPKRPGRLNFLLTNGETLVASCWNNTLHWVQRVGVHDCEICGIPHIHREEDAGYRAAVVASEPISDECWQEVPQASVIGVDAAIGIEVRSIRPS